MIRIVIENLLLFLLPTLLYVTYEVMTREVKPTNAELMADAPLIWLFIAGALLVIVTLIAFGSNSGGKPGQAYEPPVYKDGKIEPGHLK